MKTVWKVLAVVLLLATAGHALADSLTAEQVRLLNTMSYNAKRVGLGTKLNTALSGATGITPIPLFWYGALGHNVGVNSDGVIFGSVTPQAIGQCYLGTHALTTFNSTVAAALCITSKTGGTVYTDESTAANNATANDVHSTDTTGAVNNCLYVGLTAKKFNRIDMLVGTQGNFSGTAIWEYWNGAWVTLTTTADGDANMAGTAAQKTTTFAAPADWTTCQVNSTTGYWVRQRITVATSGGGHLLTNAYPIVADADQEMCDYTTAANSAGAGDVNLLPVKPVLNDAVYFGQAAKFYKIKATYSQALTVGAGVITIEYSKGAGVWGTLTCQDATATWVTTAGTMYISFVPPSDWATDTVGGTAGDYWVRFRLSTEGVTQQPLGSQFWVDDGTHGAGFVAPVTGTLGYMQTTAQTASGTGNDSKFLVVDVTTGAIASYVWTKATNMCRATVGSGLAVTAGDQIMICQVINEASTQFATANFILEITRP
jgi:hypothetical protein